MAGKKDVHVVPRDNGWAVKVEGSQRASSVHQTKQQAMDTGRDRARQDKVELVIHNKDGRISDSDSYGNDPFPPRDKVR
ncbi:MAG TPA: DUF2188 domain-containing protein [Usitatibacter sp.]|jgi:hypothetical protein|nr:DUF2188 domain-containing protein [Usitatibacter sp.]